MKNIPLIPCGSCQYVLFDPDPNDPDWQCTKWKVGLKGGSEPYKDRRCDKIN